MKVHLHRISSTNRHVIAHEAATRVVFIVDMLTLGGLFMMPVTCIHSYHALSCTVLCS